MTGKKEERTAQEIAKSSQYCSNTVMSTKTKQLTLRPYPLPQEIRPTGRLSLFNGGPPLSAVPQSDRGSVYQSRFWSAVNAKKSPDKLSF